MKFARRPTTWLALGALALAAVTAFLQLAASGRPDQVAVLPSRATAGIDQPAASNATDAGSTSARAARPPGSPVPAPGANEAERRGARSLAGEGGEADPSLRPLVPWRVRVVERHVGSPIAGASVELTWGKASTTGVTDEDGELELAFCAGVAADVAVTHADYVDRCLPALAATDGDELEFALEPSSRLRGRLEPLPSRFRPADVTVVLQQQRTSSQRFWTRVEGTVDDGGEFSFEDLEPGQYALAAEVTTGSVETETGIDVGAGETRAIRLVWRPGAELYGTVSEKRTGLHLGGLQLELHPRGIGLFDERSRRRRTSRSAEDGTWSFSDLAPGEYRLSVISAEGGRHTVKVELPQAGGSVELEVELPGWARLAGRVVDAAGAPLEGVQLAVAHPRDERWSARLGASALAPDGEDGLASVRSARDGRFEFTRVPAGTALLLVATFARPNEPPLSSVTELERMTPDSERSDLELVLFTELGLHGRVRTIEGAPVAGARVRALRGIAKRNAELARSTTDAAGRFALAGLAPGELRIVVDGEGILESDRRVDVAAEGPSDELELVVATAAAVEGLALDEEGAGVAGLPIRLRLVEEDAAFHESDGRRRKSIYGTSDDFGRFRIEGVPPGLWKASGSSYSWEHVASEPELFAVPEQDFVTLRFQPRERRERFAIRGLVTLADGGIPQGLEVDGIDNGHLSIDAGEFRATGLAPTRYRLRIRADGHAALVLPSIDPVPGGEHDIGRVELLPAVRYTVNVLDARQRPVDDAEVELRPLGTEEGGAGDRGRRLGLAALGDGRYRTKDATSHRWRLTVRAEGHPDWSQVVELDPRPRQGRVVHLR